MTTTADASALDLSALGFPAQIRSTEDTERELSSILENILSRPQIAVEANFFDDLGADSMLMAQFCARVRKQPGLPKISMKDVYRNPTLRSLTTALLPDRSTPAPVSTANPFAELLAGVLSLDAVDLDAHFFDDLGADSMLMAQFCARVRKQPGLPKISMKDVYATPTLRSLAAANVASEQVVDAPAPADLPAADAATDLQTPVVRRSGALTHFVCGLAQTVFLLGTVFLSASAGVIGYRWVQGGHGLVEGYLRLVGFLAVGYLVSMSVPLAAKWLLIGRWTPREFPAWGPTYFRFWVAKTLLTRNPVVATMIGSPLYPLYLRALGARIGPGTAIFSRQIGICADLFSAGAGTVIRKGAIVQCYRIHDGIVQLGPVQLGSGVVVGEAAILDIDTSIGDGGQLGHASALQRGQHVPAQQSWHGSPAGPGEVDFHLVPDAPCSRRRRAGYAVFQVLGLLFVAAPVAVGIMIGFSIASLWLSGLPLSAQGNLASAAFWGQALVMATILTLGGLLVGLAVVLIAPAVLSHFLRPGLVHPLYGSQYALARAVTRLSNLKVFTQLLGDSSAIVGYLQGLGYHLSPVQQTGTNFGMTVGHDNPALVRIGTGTVVADGLMMVNSEVSATSFRLAQVSIGANNFLGNGIVYPSRGRTGDDCLLATKVMIPIDGPVREGVGLLGSPAFEIPRTVARDTELAMTDPATLATALRAKNRHNVATIGLKILELCVLSFLLVVCAEAAAGSQDVLGPASFGLAAIALLIANLAFIVVANRTVAHLAGRFPAGCTIYGRAFWRHERYWKLAAAPAPQLFAGTPLRPWIWRALGVRIGRRALDDGIWFVEKSFVSIGDDATLNANSGVQTHSQEDGAFKSDHSTLGDRVTLGVGAFVHYGVRIEDGAVIAPDSFVMKGEEVPARSYWGGNPARDLTPEEVTA